MAHAIDFNVQLMPQDVARVLDQGIMGGSITGERIDYYGVGNDAGHGMVVLVYEKHYYRAGNRLTLTVSIDNLNTPSGISHVHAIGGGGGEGLLRFDWGASESFTNAPFEILREYTVQ